MKTSFYGKFLIAIALLSLPQLAPKTANTIFCSTLATAGNLKGFGDNGLDGKDGKQGRNGRSSDSLTVFADGSPMTLDLSGENGLNGNDGMDGKQGICSEIPQDVKSNVKAANGGNGGDGGNGGNGGNGGSLTVYTTDKSYLKQIYAIAINGEGGEGGIGGQGAIGCKCPVPHWNQETCKGKPGSSNYKCKTSEFQCTDGYGGSSGRSGVRGSDGQIGNLTVINLDKSLSEDIPETTLTLSELKNRGFTLSRNNWETKQGASSLLAPGSIVADEYQELISRDEHTVLLVWDAPQAFSEFEKQKVTLALEGSNDASIDFSDKLWLKTKKLKRDKLTELFIFNLVKQKDVTKLKAQGISGVGTNLKLKVLDRADKSDLLSTDFQIKYQVTKITNPNSVTEFSKNAIQFQGTVPPEVINRDRDLFTINLGQLPISPEYLASGTSIKIELIANRSLEENSKTQKMTIKTTI